MPYGDLTTDALPLRERLAQVQLAPRAEITLSGIEEAARLFALAGVSVSAVARSGQRLPAGALLLQGQGPAAAVLRVWKVAQNLVEFMSGIATATAAIRRALDAAGCPVPLACTRKNAPGTRALSAQAVRDGGGLMHRLGLSETLLVFPEHRALLAPGVWPQVLPALVAAQPEKRVVVEVATPAEAIEAARAGAGVLQLERFSPDAVAELQRTLVQQGLAVPLAPAGGVTLDNAVAYARAGAALLVSSAPYLARPADIQVTIAPAAQHGSC